jgi:hypothetical protein
MVSSRVETLDDQRCSILKQIKNEENLMPLSAYLWMESIAPGNFTQVKEFRAGQRSTKADINLNANGVSAAKSASNLQGSRIYP